MGQKEPFKLGPRNILEDNGGQQKRMKGGTKKKK